MQSPQHIAVRGSVRGSSRRSSLVWPTFVRRIAWSWLQIGRTPQQNRMLQTARDWEALARETKEEAIAAALRGGAIEMRHEARRRAGFVLSVAD